MSDSVEAGAYVAETSDPVAHDIPSEICSAKALLECSLCDTPCFEYPRFFMESERSGYVWGRRCPRGQGDEGSGTTQCSYVLCYPCVLRLPAPAFACPACRYEIADEIALPEVLREWRESKDQEQEEFQQRYDLLYDEHRRLMARASSGHPPATDMLLRALIGRANRMIAEDGEDGEPPTITLAIDISDSEEDEEDETEETEVENEEDDDDSSDLDWSSEEEEEEDDDEDEDDDDEDFVPDE